MNPWHSLALHGNVSAGHHGLTATELQLVFHDMVKYHLVKLKARANGVYSRAEILIRGRQDLLRHRYKKTF